MTNFDGDWTCTTETPMGPMTSVLSVRTDGAGGFTGANRADLGTLDVIGGRVDGNRLLWTMELPKPVRIMVHASATIDGDRLTGEVRLGAFGTGTMSGTRKA